MALILLPETVPTQAPNGCPLGKLRVIVTLPERLVKSFYPTIQTSHAERAAATGQRSPAGPRRLGTATRISASLFRRLSVLSGSTADQGPKTAKFAILSHGHAGFPNRVKRSEGSDTTPTSHVQKVLRTERKNSNITKLQTDHAAQRGRDAFGTATRISASLLRRLSAFFRSVSDQDPKAAKFAVLPPGHAGFPKRVKQSEGSNSAPVRNGPCFAV